MTPPPSTRVRPGTVLMAMSGGVDSSVAAAILHRQDYQVVGATMKTFCYGENPGSTRSCCGLEGIADAKSVADRLDIPHAVFDVEESFTEDVVENFVSEYAAGRTPIPCVRCNSFTKFGDLVRRADNLGCDFIATGHYARIRGSGPEAELCRAADDRKDQTYFLWGIPRSVLPRLLLPIGDLDKPSVRSLARELDLKTADKAESFEICFVPDNDYAGVLRTYLGDDHPALSPGPVLLEDGTAVGMHEGYARFTVGQRKGLPGGNEVPMFVVRIVPEERTVVVGPRAALATCSLTAGDANWLADEPRPGEVLGVRIRHGAAIVDATVLKVSGEAFELRLASPQGAVTPGQSAVLYRDDLVVGGGVIY